MAAISRTVALGLGDKGERIKKKKETGTIVFGCQRERELEEVEEGKGRW